MDRFYSKFNVSSFSFCILKLGNLKQRPGKGVFFLSLCFQFI